MKIVVNKSYRFRASNALFEELGIPLDDYGYLTNEDFGIVSVNEMKYRADPRLISAIEKIGIDDASGRNAELVIVDIPDDVEWYIETDEDGEETIHEKHRMW